MVEIYAIIAVMVRSLPAPFPSSPIAGVTSPRMIKGMEKERKSPNMELKVAKSRPIHKGRNCPNNMPAAMAMIILANNDILTFFQCEHL